MADDAIQTTAIGNGQWGSVSIQIPDFLEGVRDTVNDLFDLLNQVLELVNITLEFAKTFLSAFLDPISSLVQAIIDEINAFIRDFKQIGLYLTGDWNLLAWPPEDLRGGFQQYERRMISRLSDRTDSTRPDVSSRTDVYAFFGYLSVDQTQFEQLFNFVLGLTSVFGHSVKPPSLYPVPVIKDLFYGAESVSLANPGSFKVLGDLQDTPPDQVRVTWTVKAVGSKHPLNPIPQVGPKGFVVTVSTFEQPMSLHYNRVVQEPGKERKEGQEGKDQQKRETGRVLDAMGTPVYLYGGADMVDLEGSSLMYNDSFNGDGTLKDQKGFVFGRLDPNSNEAIPLEILKDGGTYFFQRTFFVDASWAVAQWHTSEYSLVLNLDTMPHRGKLNLNSDGTVEIEDLGVGGTYYVRVAACSEAVGAEQAEPKWVFNDNSATTAADKAPAPFRITFQSGLSSVGPFSQAKRISFPDAFTQEYLKAVETALLVLLLSRSDLSHIEELAARRSEDYVADVVSGKVQPPEGVVARYTGMEASRALLDLLFPLKNILVEADVSPVKFRALLRRRIKQIARDIYEKTGPIPEVEQAVVEQTENLRTVTWDDIVTALDMPQLPGVVTEQGPDFRGRASLLEALSPDAPLGRSDTYGIASNMASMGVPPGANILERFAFSTKAVVGRSPDFFEWGNGDPEEIVGAAQDAELEVVLERAAPFVRYIYDKFIQINEEGKKTLDVPTEVRDGLTQLMNVRRTVGSFDLAPVFMYDPANYASMSVERPVVYFCRHLFREYHDGVLYREANTALQMATSAMTRSPNDGEWIALRLFDAFPEMDSFFSVLEQWLNNLARAVESIVDTIIKYIEFVQAAISDLQALIRRLNALIQSFLAFTSVLPSFSGLVLQSKGTDNLLANFVSAENKPSDSANSYGAGVAIVAVSPIPLWVIDLIFLIKEKVDDSDETPVERPPSPVGVEELEPDPPMPPDPDPL